MSGLILKSCSSILYCALIKDGEYEATPPLIIFVNDFKLSSKNCIMIGDKNSDFLATIPMSHEMNSLNVATAVSAIVFERLRQVLS